MYIHVRQQTYNQDPTSSIGKSLVTASDGLLQIIILWFSLNVLMSIYILKEQLPVVFLF